jgi:hypothetical protein
VVQAINILVLLILYAGVVYFQWSFLERRLRTPGGRSGFARAIVRAAFSVLHTAVGLFVFSGIEALLNAIVNRDYRVGIFGWYSNLIPVGGGLFGLLVPWLPLLWGRPDK